jgi:hypothetical protein
MDQTILVNEQVRTAEDFLNRLGKTMPIRGAFWLKDFDDPQWQLGIIVDHVGLTTKEDSHALWDALRPDGLPDIERSQIRLYSPDDRFPASILEYRDKYRLPKLLKLMTTMMGGKYVQQLLIYPALNQQVLQAA